MTDKHLTGQERRRYFRVPDQLLIGFRVVDESKLPVADDSDTTGSALGQLENLISEQLSKIRGHHPAVCEVLELFNQKINVALSLDEKRLESVSAAEKSKKDVNLSACGIAFPVEENIPLGSKIQLDMTLLPSYINLNVEAQVIDIAPRTDLTDGDLYLLRADFVGLSQVDQELLVQHVVKCQAQMLKARREARENE